MVEMVTVMAVTRLCFLGVEAIKFPENIIKDKPKFTQKEPINFIDFLTPFMKLSGEIAMLGKGRKKNGLSNSLGRTPERAIRKQ